MPKTEKERNIEILEHTVARENQLIANWKKYNVSQTKIDALTAKKNNHTNELDKWKNK